MPLARVREFGRFVKNQRLARDAALGVRAVPELLLCAWRLLLSPQLAGVEAFVGEFEDHVVRRALDFFHVPLAVLRGGLPVFAAGHFLNPALERRDRHPFAVLVSDLAPAAGRPDAIEQALRQPGQRGLRALAALQQMPSRATSSLIPRDGLPELANTPLPQADLALATRRRMRSLGDQLRSFAPFSGLSDIEATTLRTVVDESHARRGDTIFARGDKADGLYLIAAGRATVHSSRTVRSLGPGDAFGAVGLTEAGVFTAEITAQTPVTLLRLRRDVYRRFLRDLPDVDLQLTRAALTALTTDELRICA
jgi:hypothetical protein